MPRLLLIGGRLDFDLVLIDMRSDDAELLRFILEAAEGSKKVFVVASQTGPVAKDFIGFVKSPGADDAMFRPYLPEFLRWRIKDLLRGKVSLA